MKRSLLYIIIISCFCASITGFSQERTLKKAKNSFNDLSYINASKIYLKLAESGYVNEELLKNLGDSYYFTANYADAAKWYGELFKISDNDLNPKYYLRYAQSLRNIGEDAKSEEYYDAFVSKSPSVSRLLITSEYKKRIQKNSGRYNMETTSINGEGVDFGTAILNDSIAVFSTTDTNSGIVTRIDSWSDLAFMDLYQATINTDGDLEEVTKLKGEVNTKFHETTPVFTSDGNTMYFTRNNTTPNEDQSVQRLKIYRATLENGKWRNVEELSINSDRYSTAHPALSPDNKMLYFVSNRPGGEGMTDLYSAKINSNGSIGIPERLSQIINTPGRESFPFVTEDNKLYFSSDGHYGLGGYDVFYIDLNDSDAEILNVGKPINSSYDDIAYVINPITKKGFVSSNRDGGEGMDDIYRFTETEPINTFKCSVKGVVTDKETGVPLANTTITISDLQNTTIAKVETDSEGAYQYELKCFKDYLIRAEKDSYATKEEIVKLTEDDTTQDFQLELENKKVGIGTDVAPLLDIENIYFDYDKSNIRPDAELELQKIVALLNAYPSIKLDIRSHTDSRSNDAYNLALSNRRAASTRKYLINNGIDASRLTSKGYGETELVNRCSNGVKCSKAEHQQNRRSEFIITEK